MYIVRYNDGYLAHYGKGHLDGGHSGRYPWGSGKEPGTDAKGKTNKLVNYGFKGQRKINASKEERIARGEALTKQGSNTATAILSYFGRNLAQEVGAIPVTAVAAGLATVGMTTGNPVISGIGIATYAGVYGSSIFMGVNNIIRTYQDVADMSTYTHDRLDKLEKK